MPAPWSKASRKRRRHGGLAIEKRERRDGGFGMEMMDRRGGGLQWRRGRGACGSDLGLDERAGAL